jgi:hypothetical protein
MRPTNVHVASIDEQISTVLSSKVIERDQKLQCGGDSEPRPHGTRPPTVARRHPDGNFHRLRVRLGRCSVFLAPSWASRAFGSLLPAVAMTSPMRALAVLAAGQRLAGLVARGQWVATRVRSAPAVALPEWVAREVRAVLVVPTARRDALRLLLRTAATVHPIRVRAKRTVWRYSLAHARRNTRRFKSARRARSLLVTPRAFLGSSPAPRSRRHSSPV